MRRFHALPARKEFAALIVRNALGGYVLEHAHTVPLIAAILITHNKIHSIAPLFGKFPSEAML